MEVKVRATMAAVALAEDRVAKTVAVDSKAAVVSSPQVGLVGGAAERAAVETEVAAVRAEAATEAAVRAAVVREAAVVRAAAVVMGVAAKGLAAAVREDPSTDK